MIYEDIYALTPIREVQPDWWKLAWRPLWRKTFSTYWSGWSRGVGIYAYWERTRNGWGRSYSRLDFVISTPFGRLNMWLKWNYVVHKDGPFDVAESERRPLSLPNTTGSK
jgi:hypothetical protein